MISASKQHVIQIDTISPIHFMVYCKVAAQNFGWEIQSVTDTGMVAFAPKSFLSWGERVTVRIEEKSAIIESSCIGGQRFDWGKNNSNINKLTNSLAELQGRIPEDDLQVLSEEIMHPENVVKAQGTDIFENQVSGGFFSLFVPREGYFITPILVNLNILVFLLMAISGVSIMNPDIEQLVKWGANFKPETLQGQPWRLFTACFLHIGIFHLALNMYALIYIGVLLEPFLGRTRFAVAYILTGLLGSAASLWWHDNTVSAGASGAIFGMYGLFLALLTTNLIEKTIQRAFLTSIGLFIGINLLNGITGASNVDNAGHIGGLIGGILIGYAFVPGLRKQDVRQTHFGIVLLLSLATLAAVTWTYKNTSNDWVVYEEKMKEFQQLEIEALAVYELQEKIPVHELIVRIDTQGTANWKKCLQLLDEMEKLDLPMTVKQRIWKMKDYCRIRIDSYRILKARYAQNTNAYDSQLEAYNTELEKIIRELGATK